MSRAALVALLVGCSPLPDSLRSLEPYPNPVGPGHPMYAPQPHRDHPAEVAVDGAGRAWVSLPGTVDLPGSELAVVDGGHVERVALEGSSPVGLAVHPDGRWLVAFQRFSNFAALVDTERDRVVDALPMEFYAVEGAFTPDGRELWVTNRWRDAVVVFAVDEDAGGLRLRERDRIGVGTNPRDLAVSADGRTVAVAALTGGIVTLIDTGTHDAVAIDLRAPANGLAWVGDHLVVATTSASTNHPPLAGPDGDLDGHPGDGTPNVNFQDLQNELAVIDRRDASVTRRYTSDTICCRDYRDVDPDDLDRYGDLLPPRETWIVEGALPEQVVADRDAVWVSFPGSGELQRFEVDVTGQLTPHPAVPAAGHAPHGMAVHGGELLVVHQLSETLAIHDADDGSVRREVVVGDLAGGRFPSTDAEIGELFNTVTAPFTVDGDQSCAMCHREGSNIDKAIGMPLTRYPGIGLRMTMAYRGAGDTRPWFFESAFDQDNFKPVMNEFARIENFCCTDYVLFPDGAPPDCATNPPPECDGPNAASVDGFAVSEARGFPHPRPRPDVTRDAFYLRQAAAVFGRTESFGDTVYQVDPLTGDELPVSLVFEGVTRSLGAFLMIEPRLLPNPNPADRDTVRRGKALFERSDVACATCHPAPTFSASIENNPSNVPLRMGPVVTPHRDADGVNLDLLADGFIGVFPLAEQTTCDEVCGPLACDADPNACDEIREVRFGAPQLRGIWDRARSMLHDGRARGLREVLCTPGHPALLPGEQGFNERDGAPDTHGGTSHLSERDIADLIAYLETL